MTFLVPGSNIRKLFMVMIFGGSRDEQVASERAAHLLDRKAELPFFCLLLVTAFYSLFKDDRLLEPCGFEKTGHHSPGPLPVLGRKAVKQLPL